MAEEIKNTETTETTEAPKKTTRKKAPAKQEPRLVIVKALRTYISREKKEIRAGSVYDLEKSRADALAARNIIEILK